jgi:MFS family permease
MTVSSLFALLVRDPADSSTASKAGGSPSSWRAGWDILFGHPLLVRVAWTDFFQFAADTVWIGGIMLAFVRVALHADSTWWGFLNGSYTAGCTVGGLLATMWSRYLLHRFSRTLAIGSLSIAVFTFLFAMSASPLWATVLCFLMGPPYQMREITVRTLLQTRLSSEELPGVLAAYTTLTYLAFGGGALVMGTLADHLSIRSVYVLSALTSLVVALFSARLGRLDQSHTQSMKEKQAM